MILNRSVMSTLMLVAMACQALPFFVVQIMSSHSFNFCYFFDFIYASSLVSFRSALLLMMKRFNIIDINIGMAYMNEGRNFALSH